MHCVENFRRDERVAIKTAQSHDRFTGNEPCAQSPCVAHHCIARGGVDRLSQSQGFGLEGR